MGALTCCLCLVEVWEFIYISLGSLGIGVLFGVSITLLFKYADWSHQKELQVPLCFTAVERWVHVKHQGFGWCSADSGLDSRQLRVLSFG